MSIELKQAAQDAAIDWLRKVAYYAGKQPALGSGSLKTPPLHKF